MNNYFQYEDKYGNVAYLTERGDGNVFLGVRESTGGLLRSVIVPRAALIEWLSGGRPEAQAALMVTDGLVEDLCKAFFRPSKLISTWAELNYGSKCERRHKTRTILTAALAAAQVPVWEPCQRDEIKRGDRYRVEDKYGATEAVADEDFGIDHACSDQRWFRIPAPVETAEWPDGEHGDLFRATFTGHDGVKHEDMLVYLNNNWESKLFAIGRPGGLRQDEAENPDSPATLHKVTRLKVVEA